MTTPDTFKGFGIPQAIKIVPLRRADEAEFSHALAAYQRQGLSTQRALNLVAVSTTFHMLEEAGFKPEEDFRYDSASEGIWLSDAANDHIAANAPPGAMERVRREFGMPDPCEILPGEIDWQDGEPWFSPSGTAKFISRCVVGPDPEKASAMAIGILVHGGLPDADARELVRHAQQGESGAVERLIQRLEAGCRDWRGT